MTKPAAISASLVREALHYDPISGDFTWRKTRKGVSAPGAKAGTRSNRYLEIGINGLRIKAHRLAWLYVFDEWPDNEIDHKDGNGMNNALSNLRLATRSQNNANRRQPKNTKSGLRGVVKDKKRWRAEIRVNNHKIYLGSYATPEEAHAAYKKAAADYFGQFGIGAL